MDLTQPTGYRPYDPDPHTATGIQAVTTDQAGSGYQALASRRGESTGATGTRQADPAGHLS